MNKMDETKTEDNLMIELEPEAATMDNCRSAKRSVSTWYQRCLTWGTLFDLILMVIILLMFVVSVEFGVIPHRKQGFFCGDPTISFRFTGDTITNTPLITLTLFSPIVGIAMTEKLRHENGASFRQMWLWYRGYLVLIAGFTLMIQTLKATTGGLRPHFLHTCAPDAAQNCTVGEYIAEYECLNTGGFTGYIVPDSSCSFPSAHAGFATIMSIYCAVFLHKRFRTHHLGVLIKPVLISLVLTWPLIVCISRVQDYRHHWWDVTVGVIIGMTFVTYSIVFHCQSFKLSTMDYDN